MYNNTSEIFTNVSALVSPVIDFKLNDTFETAEITLPYDSRKVNDLSNLSLFYFIESLGTFVKIESSVDPVNDTVTGNHYTLLYLHYFRRPEWNSLFKAEMNLGSHLVNRSWIVLKKRCLNHSFWLL